MRIDHKIQENTNINIIIVERLSTTWNILWYLDKMEERLTEDVGVWHIKYKQ